MVKRKFKACALQFDVKTGDSRANLSWIEKELEMLARKQVSLVVLPELFAPGFDNGNMEAHARKTPEILDRLSQWARRYAMAICGSLPALADSADNGQDMLRVYNTLYFVDLDGEIKGNYRKLHLFPLSGEPDHYLPGDQLVVADTLLGRVGLMICYDLRFPELARELTLAGAETLVVPAQWPSPRMAHWDVLIQARAIDNQAYVIAANRLGRDGRLVYTGGSQIVDPMGKVLDRAGTDSSMAMADIDLDQVDGARKLIPMIQDRRPDIYGRKEVK
ncbi:MAG: carbon-nitrogen family hydrolase [Desulfobacterales bacterium]|nr:carbon-nitrogen family hydrolase [Desulfobacterales bacterium]